MKKEAPLNFKQSENSKPGSKPLKQKIFISHSSDDKEVCKAFVDFLERLGIEEDQILYSSSSRHGIPAEMDIFNFLRGEIDGGITVYYMLSDNYYSSPYCLNEMGAAWVKQNDSKTFILPNLTGGIRGVIDDGNKGYALNDSYDLIQLKNNLCKEFNLKVTEGKFDDIKQNLLNEARNVHQ
nr:toll/interleukin-1 receptor domain-containing protein [Pontibacillus yanchengensis]